VIIGVVEVIAIMIMAIVPKNVIAWMSVPSIMWRWVNVGFFPKNRISGAILVARQFAVQTAQIIRIVANPIHLQ